MTDIAEAADAWEALASDCQRFAYMTRAVELQKDAIDRLDRYESVLDNGRQEARRAGDGDSANMWLAMQTILHALRSELQMFVALKEDRTGEAWDHLVFAQNSAVAALRAHRGADAFEAYSARLLAHEQNLFPPQVFFSPAMTVGRSECSICGSPYGECIHVAGRAYNGEFCSRIITEVTEVREVSFVIDPKDKRRRIFAIKGEDGIQRDVLTWRPVAD